MSFQMPTSPNVGETFPVPNPTWTWDGVKWAPFNAWQMVSQPINLIRMDPKKILDTSTLQGAMAFTTQGPMGGSISLDFNTFINTQVTLNANSTLTFPVVSVTPLIGRSGIIAFYMASTATISFQTPTAINVGQGFTFHRFAAQDVVTTAGNYNIFGYTIWTANRINLALLSGGVY